MVGDNTASSSFLNFITEFVGVVVDLLSAADRASPMKALLGESALVPVFSFLSVSMPTGNCGPVTAGLTGFNSSVLSWLPSVMLVLVLGTTVLSDCLSSFRHEEDSRADNSCFSLSRLVRSFQSSSSEDALSEVENFVSSATGTSDFSEDIEEPLESDISFELLVINVEGFSKAVFSSASPFE